MKYIYIPSRVLSPPVTRYKFLLSNFSRVCPRSIETDPPPPPPCLGKPISKLDKFIKKKKSPPRNTRYA